MLVRVHTSWSCCLPFSASPCILVLFLRLRLTDDERQARERDYSAEQIEGLTRLGVPESLKVRGWWSSQNHTMRHGTAGMVTSLSRKTTGGFNSRMARFIFNKRSYSGKGQEVRLARDR